MKENMMEENVVKQKQPNKTWVYVVFAVLMMVQLANIIYYFAVQKEGFHSDEIWSYGYANSYYKKDIHLNADGSFSNMNAWYDAQFLEDYIVVNEGEEFKYDSIYNNQIYDLSPPFHSMVLHTICSFFPGQFSKWFSFAINIFSFVLCMVFLFKTAKLLKGEIFALLCCALYGFTIGARDTYIYLRMYALCAALVMIIVYNTLKYLQKNNEDNKLFNYHLFITCAVSFIAFLTHYHMISLMGMLTFCICALLFFNKKWKEMFAYGLGMLFTLIISFVVFPSMFQMAETNVVNVAEGMDYNFEIRCRVLSNFLMRKSFNIKVPISSTGIIPIVLGCIVFLFIVCTPLMIFLRKTSFMQRIIKSIKLCVKRPLQLLKYYARRIKWIYLIFIVCIVTQVITVSETTRVYAMGVAADRYLFCVYPLTVLVGVAFIHKLGTTILKKKRIRNIVFAILLCWGIGINQYNCVTYSDYMFLRDGDVQIEDVIANQDCIFIRNEPWMLTTMTPVLMCADEVAQVEHTEYERIKDLYNEKAESGPVMVVLDISFTGSAESTLSADGLNVPIYDEKAEKRLLLYQDILNFMEDLEPETEMEYKTMQLIYRRPMYVYLINP